MNSKTVYSLAAFAIAAYAIAFLRSGSPAADRHHVLHTVYWQLVDGQLTDGPRLIQLDQDQELQLIVQSTSAEQLYLAGYDQTLKLTPNTSQELRLPLHQAGRFTLKLTPQMREIGILEVSPEQ